MPRPHLELVHHQGVGWQDTTDHQELKARGIPLALTPEGTTIGVAEHTVLLILAALKLLPFADSELRQGRFHVNALRPISRELSGMTVGYVGMGRIAQAVAQRLRAFGTRGIFFDPSVSTADGLATRHVRSSAAGGRCGDAASAADRRDTPPDRRRRNRADEAWRVSGQHRARRTDRRSGAGHGARVRVTWRPRRSMCSRPSRCLPGIPLTQLKNVVLTPHISAGTRDALHDKDARTVCQCAALLSR